MNLKEQIINDLKEAMKAQDSMKLNTLRMMKTEITNFEVSGADKVAGDEEVLTILKRGVKQRKEAAEGFEKGGNQEAADKEKAEIEILESYLPEMMSEDAVKEVVQAVIDEMSATQADFGKVMGAAMGRLKGQADGTVVSKVTKELLG